MTNGRFSIGDALRGLNRASGGRIRKTLFALAEAGIGRHVLQGAARGENDIRYGLTIPGPFGPFHIAARSVAVVGWAFDMRRGAPLPARVTLGGRCERAAAAPRPDLVIAFAPMMRLPLHCGIEVELPARLGLSMLRVEVEMPEGQWKTIYRTLVLTIGAGARSDQIGRLWRYRDWRVQDIANAKRPDPSQEIASLSSRVTIILVGTDAEAIDTTLASLRQQTCNDFSVILVGATRSGGPEAAPDLATGLSQANGEAVMPLRAGDRLRPHALETLLSAFDAEPRPDLVYANEESEHEGSFLPYFKPGWSPDTLEAFDYLGAPILYRGSIARTLLAQSAYDLALMFTERSQHVVHLRAVLCQRVKPATSPDDPEGDGRALVGRLTRTGRSGRVAPIQPGFAAQECRIALADPAPLVSIVIPTAGRDLEIDGRRIDLVLDCVRAIQQRSTYGQLEFVIVVNPDLPPAKARTLESFGCRVLVYEEPVFNVAKKLNMGVAAATGAFVLLLNDDIDIVSPDWIERLVAQASKPHVGVVGAKLLYTDRTIQHAGVVLFGGDPYHVRRVFPREELGYFFSTCAPRNYLAVTGACMLSRTEVYRAVGGFTEALAVNFNDVDYCLKVRELGLHVVYEPGCELIHYESVSRSSYFDADEHAYLHARWHAVYANDPLYDTSAFSLRPASFEIVMREDGETPD